MNNLLIQAESYFDGRQNHSAGPYLFTLTNGIIRDICALRPGDGVPATHATTPRLHTAFVMPGLVEAHCHLFLDGGELDLTARKQYLTATTAQMLDVARSNLAANTAAGITLIRDAGDIHGVNTHLKEELAHARGVVPELRSPGRAIRKTGRYGSFMALEISDAESIERTIESLAPTADDLKILLTGIIDFENGCVKGPVQFDLAETRLIVRTARRLGLKTYAHCNGPEGLNIAVDAGIDSIEHGFFMEPDIVKKMADKGTAWVPTFAPVYFQFARPDVTRWNPVTLAKLHAILQNHFHTVAEASARGVPVVAGSDAGSYGVPHGTGLIDELVFLRQAGLTVEQVLSAATSVPRQLWNAPPANMAVGQAANFIALADSPLNDITALRQVRLICRNGKAVRPDGTSPTLASTVLSQGN